jgi:hypothetical protein
MAASKSPPPTAAAAMETAFSGFQEAMSQGERQLQAGLETFSTESRKFFEGMTDDAAAAFEQFKTCKSPFEALVIEQNWLAKRVQAYLSYGVRLAQAATPRQAGAPATSKAPEAGEAS